METYRDLLIKYYQDTWDAMPKSLRTKRQVSVMLECGHLELPFEETYKDELLALPIVTLNKMNMWSLKGEETQILDLMNTLDQDTIITDKGNIIRNKKESKGALTQDIIKSTLSNILKCPETADAYTNLIFDNRPIKETINLKRKIFSKNK